MSLKSSFCRVWSSFYGGEGERNKSAWVFLKNGKQDKTKQTEKEAELHVNDLSIVKTQPFPSIHSALPTIVSKDVKKAIKTVLQEEYHTVLPWIPTPHLKLVHLTIPTEMCARMAQPSSKSRKKGKFIISGTHQKVGPRWSVLVPKHGAGWRRVLKGGTKDVHRDLEEP